VCLKSKVIAWTGLCEKIPPDITILQVFEHFSKFVRMLD